MKTCYVAALVLAIAVVSCKQDKRTGDIITKKPVAEVHKTIQKTGDYSLAKQIEDNGFNFNKISMSIANEEGSNVE